MFSDLARRAEINQIAHGAQGPEFYRTRNLILEHLTPNAREAELWAARMVRSGLHLEKRIFDIESGTQIVESEEGRKLRREWEELPPETRDEVWKMVCRVFNR